MTKKKTQTIQIYSQGVTTSHVLPLDIVDQAIRKFYKQGYICWKVPN